MSDSNNVVQPITPISQAPIGVNVPNPGAPAATPIQSAAPISYKDVLLEAHNLSKQNSQNIFRTAVIMEELTTKLKKLETGVSDIKQQLAAIFLLSDAGSPITSTNTATKIVESQTKALRDQISSSVKAGLIAAEDTIKKVTDIIWYSFEDGGLGYQSVAALPADQQEAAIGRKAGDKIGDLKVEEIYSLVEKPNNPSVGAQDGQADQGAAPVQEGSSSATVEGSVTESAPVVTAEGSVATT